MNHIRSTEFLCASKSWKAESRVTTAAADRRYHLLGPVEQRTPATAAGGAPVSMCVCTVACSRARAGSRLDRHVRVILAYHIPSAVRFDLIRAVKTPRMILSEARNAECIRTAPCPSKSTAVVDDDGLYHPTCVLLCATQCTCGCVSSHAVQMR